ncbi:hypothetical protein HRbin02_01828 [Candidatus Calditenuaceae archaeon HR02]|nr:hypothetical protein HRbin02_01828 [Candidatus Calditenuaceae archaeon HR02]
MTNTRKPLIMVCLLATISAILHFGNANQVRGDPKLDFDSPFYVHLLLWLRGEVDAPPPQPFRMRIVMPAAANTLSSYIGVNNAFGLTNSVLWITTVTLYFLSIKKLYDLKTATIVSILFSFSVPVMVYGAAISTDMLSYLTIAASILYLATDQKQKTKSLLLLGVLLYFTTMGREVSILGIAYIFVYRILNDKNLYQALKETLILFIFATGGLATSSILVPEPGYTSYFYQALQSSLAIDKVLKELYQIIAAYHIGWILIVYTTINISKSAKGRDNLFLSSLIVGGGFIVLDHFIGIISSRFVFLTYPGFLVAIYKGAESIGDSIRSKTKSNLYQTITWTALILYITVGFLATAENNISFPTSSDRDISKLFPNNYPLEKLWHME